jgi:hypothetical protein
MQDLGRLLRCVCGPVVSLLTLLSAGCGDSTMPDAVGVAGPAASGGDSSHGAVWQQAFVAWPKEGNLSTLYGSPNVQAQMEPWLMGQVPPSPLPDIGAPVMEKVRAFNDRLIALDGGWGPVSEPQAFRAMSVRGMRKTLWSDARLSVAEGDVDRLVDLLVVMATLPRVAHAYDASPEGLLMTIGLADGFTWALRDAMAEGFGITLDSTQCDRVREAAAWMDVEGAFGVAFPEDGRRVALLEEYESRTRPRARELIAALCDR